MKVKRLPLCCIAATLLAPAARAAPPLPPPATPAAPTTPAAPLAPLAELRLALDGARVTDTAAPDALAGAVTLEARLFLPHRLHPDPTPPALQPMLQRTTSFGAAAFAGHHEGGADRLASPFAWRAGTRAGGALFADVYATPWLPIHVEAGASVGPAAVELLALATLGARIWNVRLDAGAAVSPLFLTGAFTNDVQPRFLFRAEAVLLQRIDLYLSLHTLDGGVAIRFDCDYFATPRLGLFIGAGGARGHIRPEAARDEELLGFRVGFTYWPLPRLGVTALWLPAWSSTGEAGAFDNRLRLTVAARF